jgi:hypothetical protein
MWFVFERSCYKKTGYEGKNNVAEILVEILKILIGK